MKEWGGGFEMFVHLITEADAALVETAFYAIQRRYQMENLRTFDKGEWPSFATLFEYRAQEKPDTDYYRPVDHFVQLGEWLHDATVRRKRLAENQKAESERKARSQF